MWIAFFILGIAAVLAGIVYMMFKISGVPVIFKMCKRKRGLSLIFSLLIIIVFLVVMGYLTSPINSAVIFLHILLCTLIISLIGRIMKAVLKIPLAKGAPVIISVVFCAVYLLTAYYLCKNVWQKNYNLHTDKEIGTLRVAFFADSHMGTTFDGEGFEKELRKIEGASPDILLIPGDFVDDDTTREDMEAACRALGSFKCKYGVYYAYGNHDRGYNPDSEKPFTEEDLIRELEANNVTILKDDSVLIDDRFYIVGREDASRPSRADINTLLSGLDTNKYIIVMDHQPNDYDAEAASAADLVLSGHTHGGQLFPITYLGELMGANDNTYGYERHNNTDFIVTSGISDWAVIFKSGTKSEYVIVDVE